MFVLDGALGTELETRLSKQALGDLWSGQAVVKHPNVIKDIYKEYISQGSNLITTATYQTLYNGLKRNGYDHDGAVKFWGQAVEVARTAVEESGSDCQIVGSVGPYGSFANDGSEYTGKYGDVTVQTLVEHHQPLVEYLNRSDDIGMIGFETVPNVTELKAILSVCATIDKPYFIAFCLNSEISPREAMEVINEVKPKGLVAVGMNCIDFRLVTGYLLQFKEIGCGYPYVVYPNYGFTAPSTDFLDRNYAVDTDEWEKAIRKWLEFDVFAVGGCCSTGPKEIGIINQVMEGLN